MPFLALLRNFIANLSFLIKKFIMMCLFLSEKEKQGKILHAPIMKLPAHRAGLKPRPF
jgi:hypothetical protein